jgi:hypothetical protein
LTAKATAKAFSLPPILESSEVCFLETATTMLLLESQKLTRINNIDRHWMMSLKAHLMAWKLGSGGVEINCFIHLICAHFPV